MVIIIVCSVIDTSVLNKRLNKLFCHFRRQIETFMKVSSTNRDQKKQMELLQHQLETQMKGLGLQHTDHRALVKKRHRAVVAVCLHKIGIVVPYDKKADVGYRPLPMTNSNDIKTIDDLIPHFFINLACMKYASFIMDIIA